VNGDEYNTDVEYIVTHAADGYKVRAIDRFDGEEGAVYDVNYNTDNLTLSFNVMWASTGRFMSIRLLAISPNRASYTYSYTEKEMWFRKGTEPTVEKTEKPRRRVRKQK
jgi:hypothetical protein